MRGGARCALDRPGASQRANARCTRPYCPHHVGFAQSRPGKVDVRVALGLISIVGFTLSGPYTMTSVFSLDIGGRRGAATVSALNEFCGYLAGAAMGAVRGVCAARDCAHR